MNRKNFLSCFIGLLAVSLFNSNNAQAVTKALFLTGGQSNTDGRLYAETLPDYLQSANTNCLASCHGAYDAARLGTFYAYYPTSGTTGQPARWAYDAVTYYYIGQALGETFYVAKTSYGGTSINPSVKNSGTLLDGTSWADGYGSGYHWSADETFLAATAIAGTSFTKDEVNYTGQSMLLAWIANIDAAIDAITAAGDTPDIKAIIWHQGESDKNVGSTYYANLKAMVAYVRNHLVTKTGESKYATLPFFCGTVPHASSLYNSAVEKACFTLQDEDANFHTIDLRDLTMLSDTKHFDAASAELFGKRLYNRMIDENVISGERLDVEYATVDYSDFGTDEFVGETKTWDFNSYASNLVTKTTIQDNLYLHSNNSNSRCFLSQDAAVSSVTFADATVVNTTKVLTSNNGGSHGWDPNDITMDTNASANHTLAVGLNVLYPGRFSLFVSAPTATAESTVTMQLLFNGSKVKELTFTDTTPQELYFDATTAGTFYFYSPAQFSLYAARYVPTTDHSALRTVTTDANGYATFGNISGGNLGLPSGLTAWAVGVSTTNDQMVEMNQLLGVDKGTGVLLQGAASTQYVLPFVRTAVNYEGDNAMTAQQTTGDIGETSGDDFVNYTFANKQFTKVSGTASVEAGKAYLSISNGAAQCSYSTLTFDEPEADALTEPAHSFGTEVVVGEARTWTLEDMTVAGSDGVVVEANGLYSRGQSGSNNRSWKTGTISSTEMSFSDDTKATVTKFFYLNAAYNSSTSITATTTANCETAGDYFAINALYPGTFYVLVGSHQADKNVDHSLYFNGSIVDTETSTSTDAVELKYTSEEAGTFIYFSGAQYSRVYAIRYVPTSDNTPLRQATMNSEGYALFSNLALASLTLPEGLTAKALLPGDIDADAVKQVTATVIGKGEAVLLQGTAGETYTMTLDNTQTSDVDAENLLQPILAWQKPLANNPETGYAQYIFNTNVFTQADGSVKVYQGDAILSVPATEAMAAYSTVKLTPTAVGYNYVDTYTKFGSDEVVWAETTWLCQDFGFPSKYSDLSTATGCYKGVYFNDGGSSNRSWKSASQGAGSYEFADGTAVSVTTTARSSGASSLPSVNSTHTASADLASDFAINAAVPGTFSMLRSGNSTGHLYFNGTEVATITTTGDADMQEVSYTSTVAGTFIYICSGTNNVAAMRFVPTDNNGIYNKVSTIGWTTMSLPYPAIVPEGTQVFYVSDYADGAETGTLSLTQAAAGTIIPAKAGFLFNSVKGLYRLAKSMTDNTWAENMLVGTADETLTDYDYSSATDPIFVLASLDANNVGFKKFTGTAIDQYKAYLQLGTTPEARSFCFDFGEPTAIETVSNATPAAQHIHQVFTLGGTQLSRLQKGMNIVKLSDGRTIKVNMK